MSSHYGDLTSGFVMVVQIIHLEAATTAVPTLASAHLLLANAHRDMVISQ